MEKVPQNGLMVGLYGAPPRTVFVYIMFNLAISIYSALMVIDKQNILSTSLPGPIMPSSQAQPLDQPHFMAVKNFLINNYLAE